MKNKNFLPHFLFLVVPVILIVSSCSDEETFPVTPEIEYRSLEKFTSVSGVDSLMLTFAFTDGDGDLGTPSFNTTDRDIFARLFEMKNGIFEEAVLAAPLEYRLPYLTPEGNNKSLKGEIKINIDYNILMPNDTIYYIVYIKDRAGHKSNEITTPSIITRIE